MENAKIEKFKCDILGDFQTLRRNEIIEETHSNYDTNDECKLTTKYCKILGIDGEPAYGSRHRTADDPDDIQRKRNVQVDESIKVSHHFPIGQYSSVSFILDVHEYQNEHWEKQCNSQN